MSGSAYEAEQRTGDRRPAGSDPAGHQGPPDGTTGPEIVEVEPAVTAVVRGVVPVAGMRDFFDTSFRQLAETVSRQRLAVTGPAFGFYREPPGQTVALEVGFVTDRAVRPEGDVAVGALPGGRVARTTHYGSFDGLGASWARLHAWVRARGFEPGPAGWEFYVTEPTPEMDPRDLRTQLNCLVSPVDRARSGPSRAPRPPTNAAPRPVARSARGRTRRRPGGGRRA